MTLPSIFLVFLLEFVTCAILVLPQETCNGTPTNKSDAALLLQVRCLADSRRPSPMIPEGGKCGEDVPDACEDGLLCRCLVPNRGLKCCLREHWPLLSPKAQKAVRYERQGLECKPKHLGATMPAPPVVFSALGRVIDPRKPNSDPALRKWAVDHGRGFYSRYTVVRAPSRNSHDTGVSALAGTDLRSRTHDGQHGFAVLAGDDVHMRDVESKAAALGHFLQSLRPSYMLPLAMTGVRLLVAGGGWHHHPEVNRDFESGLGGGAPWFPSTGIEAEEPANLLAEEVFHSVQYIAMSPREVCMYHNAYAIAVEKGLYTTDGSGGEIDGEPVPTVQADEYLAMALQRWLGSHDAPSEYLVPGNNASATGRMYLRQLDPPGFCMISLFLRCDDTWNPEQNKEPWRRFPNQGMDEAEVHAFCQPILENLGDNCPPFHLEWPS